MVAVAGTVAHFIIFFMYWSVKCFELFHLAEADGYLGRPIVSLPLHYGLVFKTIFRGSKAKGKIIY